MVESARENLISAVCQLILERGYGGTSVGAICDRASVSKGSFFHHFQSKQDAACSSLDHWMTAVQERARQSGFADQPDPRERLMTYLDFMAALPDSGGAPHGCLLGALALELSETHPDVRDKASGYFQVWSDGVSRLIGDAMPDRDDTFVSSLANHFIASLEGAILLAKARRDPSLIPQCVNHFRGYVESLMQPAV
ncbi:TetR/AcrR family transcriptional regulator [Rhodopirellula sp. MGV]|uniref:TetR/AcrR family transcriptional regulator n=1 Tax=Rhodopirellula sp. MGV TaxID=2023130 RepID=UPI000B9644A4|nr:TetR/AcrR family transcriptional regulator [Rhodopirellula sp. MGV]OYP38847.1 hypothetical protein CGZ80_01105 [Rhodopirellula sp. MGV]PNY37655.1 TetR/AcrR family transcriptional regulator [Rhodopirellula baltica]